ncbi:MAG: B12 lower ligand biosynthesis radical SAM protein BzaD [Nitrospirae bacterium]|nr:B12 lower ligand biosynthesis radical SAM protein BzaD [Nitrospirota bacterium]
MRLLFIQAPSVEGLSSERVYPLGIVILAGCMQQAGHEVDLFDMNMEPDPYGALKSRLLSFMPDVVGLSLRNIDPLGNKTSSLVPPFIIAAKLVAALLPEAWLIAGGTGFSLFPERLMTELPEIHYGIVGEAESSLPLLIASLDRPPEIPGLCLRTGDGIRIIPPSQSVDMDSYQAPARHLFDPSAYAEINNYVPAIGIETKRGCSFHCSYCVYPRLQGRNMRCRKPQAVVDEIEHLNKEYGIKRFHFTDPIINFPEDHLEDICNEIIQRKLNIRWDGFMREDHFSQRNAALYEKAGCECFSFSPDGLCQESLDVLDKRLSEQQILNAASIASETDVISVYHFMVNVPGETEETCEKGLRFIEKLYDLHISRRNLGMIIFNNMRILPGTPLEKIARDTGVIGLKTDLLYPTYHNPVPFDSFRYRLEALHLCRNVFMWQGME